MSEVDFDVAIIGGGPAGKIGAIEEDDSVGGRLAGSVLGAGGARSDDRGKRAIHIVDFPARVDLSEGRCGAGHKNEGAEERRET